MLSDNNTNHSLVMQAMADNFGISLSEFIATAKTRGELDKNNRPTAAGINQGIFSHNYESLHIVYADDVYQIILDLSREKPATYYQRLSDGGVVMDLGSFATILGFDSEQLLMSSNEMLDALNTISVITGEFPVKHITTIDQVFKGVKIKKPGMYFDIDSWNKTFRKKQIV